MANFEHLPLARHRRLEFCQFPERSRTMSPPPPPSPMWSLSTLPFSSSSSTSLSPSTSPSSSSFSFSFSSLLSFTLTSLSCSLSSLSSSVSFIVSILMLLSLSVHFDHCHGETLRGTTIINWPYMNRLPNGQYEGYCVDLLNELAPLMGMAYTLHPVGDGQYGGWLSANGTVNGMIGEVMRGEADFAIGDITVLSTRQRFVDFTTPFIEFGLAALVSKEWVSDGKIRNFEDLSKQTALRYGVKKIGANLPLFHDSPVIAKMYSFMDTHPSVFVSGEREGVEKVKRERYAFITESTFAEYVVQRDCSLAAIDDRRKHFEFEYAIAVQKSNPELRKRFSQAIRKLRQAGKLKELYDKYWRSDKCIADNVDGGTVLRKPNQNNNNPNSNSNRKPSIGDKNSIDFSDRIVESGDRTKDQIRFPHDEVAEEDVELFKPRPETGNRRRPTTTKRDRNGSSTLLQTSLPLVIMMIVWCCCYLLIHSLLYI